MPSSMIFVGLVVLWLLILVPAVARHRQEVAKPSVAALSGRVLERPRRRHNLEVDVTDSRERTLDADEAPRVPAARSGAATPAGAVSAARMPSAQAGAVATEPRPDDAAADLEDGDELDADRDTGLDPAGDDDEQSEPDRERSEPDREQSEPDREARYAHDEYDDERELDEDDRRWERPPPRYRPGRGGYDPEAAATAARYRYTFRQRVVLAMLVAAVVTGAVAAVSVPAVWWVHGAVDLALVGYLVYLRRQVRMEEAIRDRRAARMAGTRRRPAAEDPELDEWARRGREAAHRPDADGSAEEAEPGEDLAHDADEHGADQLGADHLGADEHDGENELEREQPERVTGTGASLSTATELSDPVEEIALPRLRPAPPPALPAGTSLVEEIDGDPDLYDLDGPARPDYRRAVGE
ncbi:MAG: hypothetical protein QOF00_4908 [Pseudonocardiales bacterium]|nr:hypothetical protein [Pseudonocardiales bacterium]